MSSISIIIPVYNAEKYLRRCINSIYAQTYDDFELLLVDDGSADSSGRICDEYAATDSRTRVFHNENQGVSSARNTGLDNAVGEWIMFMDSDDFWCDDNILKELHETAVRTEADIVRVSISRLMLMGMIRKLVRQAKRPALKIASYHHGNSWTKQ